MHDSNLERKSFMFKRTILSAAGIAMFATGANAATTLEAVKAKGFIQCGVSQGLQIFKCR